MKGLEEKNDEDCEQVVKDLLKRIGVGPFSLQKCFRLGQPRIKGGNSRPILIRFASLRDKLTVMGRRSKLQGTKVYLQDDIDQKSEIIQSQLRPIVQFLRKNHAGKKVGLVNDGIKFDGKVFAPDEIDKLPITRMGEHITNDHLYFAGEQTSLSNLFPCEIQIHESNYNWSIVLDEPSQLLTTFNTPIGRYCFKRLPFGLSVSQDLFQTVMDDGLKDLPGVVSIADDIAVFGTAKEEHDTNLRKLMERAQTIKLVFNPDKRQIKQSEIPFFGNIYTSNGVMPDPKNVQAINDLKTPSSKSEIQSFLGLITYLAP